MKVKEGLVPPNFTVTDVQSQTHTLYDYRGQKILLSFFRNVYCPFCNFRVHELGKKSAELKEKGLQMLFFFESSGEHIKRSSFYDAFPIPLIADPEKEVYEKYGIEKSTLKMLKTFFRKSAPKIKEEGERLMNRGSQEKHITNSLIPADFLIDENLLVKKAHYGADMRDHISVKEIEAFLR